MNTKIDQSDVIVTAYLLMVSGYDAKIVIDTLGDIYLNVLSQMNSEEIGQFHSDFIKRIIEAKEQAKDGYGTPH